MAASSSTDKLYVTMASFGSDKKFNACYSLVTTNEVEIGNPSNVQTRCKIPIMTSRLAKISDGQAVHILLAVAESLGTIVFYLLL